MAHDLPAHTTATASASARPATSDYREPHRHVAAHLSDDSIEDMWGSDGSTQQRSRTEAHAPVLEANPPLAQHTRSSSSTVSGTGGSPEFPEHTHPSASDETAQGDDAPAAQVDEGQLGSARGAPAVAVPVALMRAEVHGPQPTSDARAHHVTVAADGQASDGSDELDWGDDSDDGSMGSPPQHSTTNGARSPSDSGQAESTAAGQSQASNTILGVPGGHPASHTSPTATGRHLPSFAGTGSGAGHSVAATSGVRHISLDQLEEAMRAQQLHRQVVHVVKPPLSRQVVTTHAQMPAMGTEYESELAFSDDEDEEW